MHYGVHTTNTPDGQIFRRIGNKKYQLVGSSNAKDFGVRVATNRQISLSRLGCPPFQQKATHALHVHGKSLPSPGPTVQVQEWP